MTWVRFDDTTPDHPKLLYCSRAVRWDWFAAVCWSSKHMTDGYLPAHYVKEVVPRGSAKQLEAAGLWHPPGVACGCQTSEDTGEGYRIHDYLAFNPSKEQVMADRMARAKAGAKGAAKRWNSKPHGGGHSGAHPDRIDNGMPPSRPVPIVPSERERDPVFDALATCQGSNLDEMTPPEARAVGVAIAAIRRASPDVTADEIRRRWEILPSVLPPETRCTANALAKNWGRCANKPRPPLTPTDAAESIREADRSADDSWLKAVDG